MTQSPKNITLQKNKRVTIRDLARELNLSDRAVSQALSPRESNVKLRPETAKRVQDLASKRGYQRDSRARSMRYGKFFNIGYFEARKNATALPLPGAEAGVFDEASDSGYHIVLIRLPSDMSNNPAGIPNVFRESLIDALILSNAGSLPEEITKKIVKSGYPIVYLNEKLPHNAIYSNDLLGAEVITEHLIEQGRKRIALLTLSTTLDVQDSKAAPHYSDVDRKQGYLNAMKKAGLKSQVVKIGPASEPTDEKLLKWFEANHTKVDAIMCTNDFNAMRTHRLLRKYQALFPEKIQITGFDNMAEPLAIQPITTMAIPYYKMGQLAVKMALELANSDKKKTKSIVVESELLVR
jgi:LacI family transcriptional regulator